MVFRRGAEAVGAAGDAPCGSGRPKHRWPWSGHHRSARLTYAESACGQDGDGGRTRGQQDLIFREFSVLAPRCVRSITLGLVGLHILRVVDASWRRRENLVHAMLVGRKRGE